MKLSLFILIVALLTCSLNGAGNDFGTDIKNRLKDEFAGKYIGVIVQDNVPAMSVKGEFGNSAYGTCYVQIKDGGEWKHRRNFATFIKSIKGRQYCTNCFHKGDLVVVNRLKVKKNSIIIRIVSLEPKKVMKSNGEVSRDIPEPHSTDMKFVFSSDIRDNYKVVKEHIRKYIRIFSTRTQAKEFAARFSMPSSGKLDLHFEYDSLRRVTWITSN